MGEVGSAMNKLTLSISQHFMEKTNNAPMHTNKESGELSNQWAFAAFDNVQWDAAQIIAHVAAGKAFSVARLKDGHRHRSKFVSSQIMGVDFDHGVNYLDIVNDELFALEYCFYGYPTASSTPENPRCRLLFQLDQPITDGKTYIRLLKRLLHHYRDYQPDTGTKDEVRIFYGSRQPGMSFPQTVLPIAVLEALPPHPDEIEVAREAPGITSANEDYSAYVKRSVEGILGTVSAAKQGERNATLNWAAHKLGQLVASSWAGITRADCERWLENAAPRGEGTSESENRATIRSGLDAGFKEPAAPPEKKEPPKPAAPKTVDERIALAAPSLPPGELIVSSTALADGLEQEWAEVPQAPLPFPLKVLHKFRGLCQMIAPGKMIGVVGISGGMKTSFCETLMDTWRRDNGVDVLYWGPEWTPMEMAARAVQRHGTIEKPTASYDDVQLHKRWNWEEANNVPFQIRAGKKMNDSMYRTSMEMLQVWRGYKGEGYYVKHMDMTLDELLAAIDRHMTVVKTQGKALRAIVLDYVQLTQLRDVRTETERVEQALGLVKAFVVDRQLVGLVASQARKHEAEGVREAGSVLTLESGQFVRSDKFNLVLTLNPIMQDKQLTNRAIISVEKNSAGRTGMQHVVIDPARLRWVDQEAKSA